MKLRLACAAVLSLTAGCLDGTETGNPFTAEARVHAHSSEPGRVAVIENATEAQIDGVWIAAGPIALLGEDCVTQLATTETPTVGNRATLVDILSFELAPEPICRVRVPVAPVAAVPSGVPAELAGHSVLVVGRRIADGVPFQIRTTLARDVFLDAVAGPFEFSETDPGMFLGLDVAVWIDADLDLAGAPVTGGQILIEAATDPARTAAFEASFALGLELYTDHDRNGSASGEERLAIGVP